MPVTQTKNQCCSRPSSSEQGHRGDEQEAHRCGSDVKSLHDIHGKSPRPTGTICLDYGAVCKILMKVARAWVAALHFLSLLRQIKDAIGRGGVASSSDTAFEGFPASSARAGRSRQLPVEVGRSRALVH
jgi:hypothetical protein